MSEFLRQENQEELFFPESNLYNLSHEVDEKIISAFLEAESNKTLLVTVLDEIGEPCHLADADFNTLTGLRFQIKGKQAVVHEGRYTTALIDGMKWFGSQIVDANREQFGVIHELLVKLGIDIHADDIEQQYQEIVDGISQETHGEVVFPDYNLVLENDTELLDAIDQIQKYEEGNWSTNQDAATEEEVLDELTEADMVIEPEPVEPEQILEEVILTTPTAEPVEEKKPVKEVQKEVGVRILEEAEVPDHLKVLSFLNQFQVNFKDRDAAEMLYEGARVKNTDVKELLGVLLDFYPDFLVGSYISDRYKAEDQKKLSRLVYRYLYTFNDELEQIGFRSGSSVSKKWKEMAQALTRFEQEYTTREDVLIAWKDAYRFKKNGVEKWYNYFKDNDQDKVLSSKELDFLHDFLIEQKESMWEEIKDVDNLPVEGSGVHLDDTLKYLSELYDTLTLTGDTELQNKDWLAQRIKALYKTYTATQSIPTRIEMRKERQQNNDLSALGEFEEVLQLEKVFTENAQEYNQIKKLFLDFVTENLEGKPKLIQEKVLELLEAETSAVGRLIAIGLQKYVKPLLDATQRYVQANYSDEHQQAVLNLLGELISTQETLKYETIRERHQEVIDLMNSDDFEPEPIRKDNTQEVPVNSEVAEVVNSQLEAGESQDNSTKSEIQAAETEYLIQQIKHLELHQDLFEIAESLYKALDDTFELYKEQKFLNSLYQKIYYTLSPLNLTKLTEYITIADDTFEVEGEPWEAVSQSITDYLGRFAGDLADFDEGALENAEVFSGKANNILWEKVGNGHSLNVVEAKPLDEVSEDMVDGSINGSEMLDNHDLPIVEPPVSYDKQEVQEQPVHEKDQQAIESELTEKQKEEVEKKLTRQVFQKILEQNLNSDYTEIADIIEEAQDIDKLETFVERYLTIMDDFADLREENENIKANAGAFYDFGDKLVGKFDTQLGGKNPGTRGFKKIYNTFSEYLNGYDGLLRLLAQPTLVDVASLQGVLNKQAYTKLSKSAIESITLNGEELVFSLENNKSVTQSLKQFKAIAGLRHVQFEEVQEQSVVEKEAQEDAEVLKTEQPVRQAGDTKDWNKKLQKEELVDNHAPENLPVEEGETINKDESVLNNRLGVGEETLLTNTTNNELSEELDEASSLNRLREQTLDMAQDLKLFLTESKFNEEAVNLIQTLGNISWDKKVDHKDFKVTFGTQEVQAAIKQVGHNILVLHAQYQIIQFFDSLSKSKKTGALFVQHESVYNELQAAQSKEDFEVLKLPESFSELKKKQQKLYTKSKKQLDSSLSSFDPDFQFELDVEKFRLAREDKRQEAPPIVNRNRGTRLPRYQVENLVPETQSDLREAREDLLKALGDSNLQNAPHIIKLLGGHKKDFKMKPLDQFYKQANISEELRYVIDVFRYNYYLIENMKALVSSLKILSRKINPNTQLSRNIQEMYKQLLEVDGVSGLANIHPINARDLQNYLNNNVSFEPEIDRALQKYKVASNQMYINVQKVRELKKKAA